MIYFKSCCIIKGMRNDFQISHNKENYTKPIHFHSHDFYEIYFFMDGDVKYYIENESYTLTKGDVLIIPPGKLHRPVIEGNMPYERYVLWIYSHYAASREGVGKLFAEILRLIDDKNTRLVSFDGGALHTLTQLFDKLNSDFSSSDSLAYYTAEGCITLILGELVSKFKSAERASYEQGDLISRVISHINANVAEAPTLEQLSAAFFVSKYYLSHKFKEHTKTTIHQYILMKKINLAKGLLESGCTPQQVCEKCGFSTYSNFYKAFTQQTGVPPSKYKKPPN